MSSDNNIDATLALDDDIAKDVPPLRPLTSLKWPYLPEESAYPDPLKRDDPKPLQLAQYEAIGSPTLFFLFKFAGQGRSKIRHLIVRYYYGRP